MFLHTTTFFSYVTLVWPETSFLTKLSCFGRVKPDGAYIQADLSLCCLYATRYLSTRSQYVKLSPMSISSRSLIVIFSIFI